MVIACISSGTKKYEYIKILFYIECFNIRFIAETEILRVEH